MLHVHICRDNHTRTDGITTSCNREADTRHRQMPLHPFPLDRKETTYREVVSQEKQIEFPPPPLPPSPEMSMQRHSSAM